MSAELTIPHVASGEIVEKTKVGIIGGSFFRPETMEPLAAFFRIGGHDAQIISDLPTHDPNATPEDHATVLASKIKDLGNSAIVLGWSGGGAHVLRAIEKLDQEEGGHNVKLAVLVSGSLGELPPKAGRGNPAPRQPRNSQQFRNGITHPDDTDEHFVDFNREMALDVFFNLAPDIGRLLVSQTMQPQYRVDASPMPKKLSAPCLYLHSEYDHVRNLPSVLDAVEYYRDSDPHKMELQILEGKDHAVPITDPAAVWHAVMDYCVRREIEIVPPVGGSMISGVAPQQRHANPLSARDRFIPGSL